MSSLQPFDSETVSPPLLSSHSSIERISNKMSSPPPSSNTPRPTDAPHPFDQLSADLILRTADLVDFRVHSPILAQASPFFASMLALPQPPATPSSYPHNTGAGLGNSETPIVPVSEDSTTLELLLRLAYPIPKPYTLMAEPAPMVPALLAAAKYDMALPLETMSERLVALMPGSPLAVWAAACRADLQDVARQAAEVLKASWTNSGAEALSFMDGLGDMVGISAGDYYRLKRSLKAPSGPYIEDVPPTPTFPFQPAARARFFTSLPSPDVICRSLSREGKKVLLHAHQLVLCMHSPILQARLVECRPDMSPSASVLDGPASAERAVVLDFDEDADVVSALLKACYNQEHALPIDYALLAGVLVASRKYEMVAIARKAREAWDIAAVSFPLKAYLVAINHGLNECAEEAARNALRKPILFYVTVMESAPALVYHRLLIYYDACRQIFKEGLENIMKRIPDSIYTQRLGTHSSATALKLAVTNFVNGAQGVPAKTTIQQECGKNIKDAISTQFAHTGFDGLLGPLIECMTSAADTIESAIKDVRLQLA